MTPQVFETLKLQHCAVRGGIVKKAKKPRKKGKKAAV
jgi:hypothetical protein